MEALTVQLRQLEQNRAAVYRAASKNFNKVLRSSRSSQADKKIAFNKLEKATVQLEKIYLLCYIIDQNRKAQNAAEREAVEDIGAELEAIGAPSIVIAELTKHGLSLAWGGAPEA